MTEEAREPGQESTEQAAGGDQLSEVGRLRSELESANRQLEALESRSEERLHNWQRAQADLINYRRRVDQERAEQIRYANERLISRVLPILDDFERAFSALPRELYSLTWIDGVNLIAAKLMAILQQEGVKPIEAMGQAFDPTKHEAILVEGVPDPYSGVVVAELQRGYTVHDRVLRATLVKVGRGEAAGTEEAKPAGSSENEAGESPEPETSEG
jgi:molecular chaperone GrpE